MQLAADLTAGWKDNPNADFAAAKLHRMASQASRDYSEALAEVLKSAPAGSRILGLEQLFRRSTSGFQAIKRFVGAMAAMPASGSDTDTLVCRIDVFAYAFLKGAKNFDLLLPLNKTAYTDFQRTRIVWSNTLVALERFERLGEPLVTADSVSTEQYLAMRDLVSRPSARDELRALATLLVSGPSTLNEISTDLGLNFTLGQRTLAVFEHIGVVNRRTGVSPGTPVFAISESALPLTVFFLRETIGLDLFDALPKEN